MAINGSKSLDDIVKSVPIISSKKDKTNLQLALVFTEANDVKGLQAGIWNLTFESLKGVQLGVINACISKSNEHGLDFGFGGSFTGTQIGIGNYSEYSEGVQLGAGNFSDEHYGVQVGVVSASERLALGLQIGALVSISDEIDAGIQIAPICYAGEGNYLQFGLITIRENREGENKPLYKRISPLLGFRRKK